MTTAPGPEFVDAMRQALSLGLSRTILPSATFIAPDQPDAALKMMAIAGQAQRFIRPDAPTEFEPVAAINDPRRIVSDDARALLRALDLHGESPIALAIVDRMEAGGWRLHPFDLPQLSAFAKAYAERLGATVMAHFAAPADEEKDRADYFADVLDQTNWMNGTPQRKAAFIQTQRIASPALARDLVQAAFPGQNAASRLRILDTFRTGLGVDDLPFLESLAAADRAPTVKALALRLISRIPGSATFESQTRDAMSRLTRSTTGIFRKTVKIAIDYPANVSEYGRPAWAFETFTAVPIDAFVSHLGLSAEQLVDAVGEHLFLSGIVLRRAIIEARFSLAGRLVGDGNMLWHVLGSGDPGDFAALADPATGDAFVAATIRPKDWPQLPPASAMGLLYSLLRKPLSPETSSAVMAHRDWGAPIEEAEVAGRAALCAELVPLIHPQNRAGLRRNLEALPATVNRPGLNLLALHHLLNSA